MLLRVLAGGNPHMLSSIRRTTALALVSAVLLTGCGLRLGYRHSYRDPSSTGVYGGPWAALATSTAPRADTAGSHPYLVFEGAYDFARGRDAATFGGGLAFAPGALGWHNSVMFLASWELLSGVHLSVCDGYGNWGIVQACARWSSRGYVGLDLGGGLNPTAFGAHSHENCRDGCSDSGGIDWDD
jgi:hypothetical protein